MLGVLAYLVRTHELLQGVDDAVAPWGVRHATAFTHEVVANWTNFGATGGVVAVLVLVFVCEGVRRPSRWLPLFLVVIGVGQWLVTTEIKALLDRVRPTVDAGAAALGPSFPSGHTTGATACFAAAALVIGRGRSPRAHALLAGAAAFMAVSVAASRVLLGVHWLSDVVGGLALGWGWFALCALAFGGRLLRFGAPVESAERALDLEERHEADHTVGGAQIR